jgi:hypothetical protein
MAPLILARTRMQKTKKIRTHGAKITADPVIGSRVFFDTRVNEWETRLPALTSLLPCSVTFPHRFSPMESFTFALPRSTYYVKW